MSRFCGWGPTRREGDVLLLVDDDELEETSDDGCSFELDLDASLVGCSLGLFIVGKRESFS